jgi:hypothetical protein
MESEFDIAYRMSRRAYERGRLLRALRHAIAATMLIAAFAWALVGKEGLWWLPMTFLSTLFTEWRGVFLMAGARRGLVAGLAAMLLPLSVLRPCCGVDAKAMGIDCCVMPSACWAAGAAVGLFMATLLPRAPEGQRLEATLGMLTGVLSVAILRCSPLFLGEAVGLLAGVSAGVVAAAFARARLEAA